MATHSAVIHHDDLPEHVAADIFDLARHQDVIGDPDDYFWDLTGHHPRLVRHATGEPAFVLGDRGDLIPFSEVHGGKVAPSLLPEVEATPNRFHFGRSATRAKDEPAGGARTGYGFGAVAAE